MTPASAVSNTKTRIPPMAPPTTVPRLLCGVEASLGKVKWACCLTGAVMVKLLLGKLDWVVGIAVVGGGSRANRNI